MVEQIVQIIHEDWSRGRRRGQRGGLSTSFQNIVPLNSFFLRLRKLAQDSGIDVDVFEDNFVEQDFSLNVSELERLIQRDLPGLKLKPNDTGFIDELKAEALRAAKITREALEAGLISQVDAELFRRPPTTEKQLAKAQRQIADLEAEIRTSADFKRKAEELRLKMQAQDNKISLLNQQISELRARAAREKEAKARERIEEKIPRIVRELDTAKTEQKVLDRDQETILSKINTIRKRLALPALPDFVPIRIRPTGPAPSFAEVMARAEAVKARFLAGQRPTILRAIETGRPAKVGPFKGADGVILQKTIADAKALVLARYGIKIK